MAVSWTLPVISTTKQFVAWPATRMTGCDLGTYTLSDNVIYYYLYGYKIVLEITIIYFWNPTRNTAHI